MTSEWARFGRPDLFEVALCWADDPDPPERRPAGHGWSMGRIELFVTGENLTESVRQGERQPYVGWYLSPVLGWLAAHWAALLHEERFAWPERTRLPAALACRRALDNRVAACDPEGRAVYRRTHAWYHRHGLRSAALGGLFPDLFIRRWGDDVELSWTADPPPFAPEGLTFESRTGYVRLAVADVAQPLWEALQWAAAEPPEVPDACREDQAAFRRTIEALGRLDATVCERAHVPGEVLGSARAAFDEIDRPDLFEHRWHADRPYVEAFSPAVAMYGGVSPDLGRADVRALRDALAGGSPGQDGAELSGLVEHRRGLPLDVPYLDGDRFAADLLEDLGEPGDGPFVDVRRICAHLAIAIEEIALETGSIRGIALAGEGFSPRIVINLTHVYNTNEEGKRFTIGHELCHILFDRTRARRIAHVSGAWAAPGIEKRANAFAAYLLMPRELVVRNRECGARIDGEETRRLAALLRVNESALVEHLYNIDLIDYVEREQLRTAFRAWR